MVVFTNEPELPLPPLDAEQLYLFGHSLYREVVYEGLSPLTHARLHGVALQFYEEMLGLDDDLAAADSRAGELAQHAQAARLVTQTSAEYDLLMRKEQQYIERAARFSMPRRGPAETQTGEVSRSAGDVLRQSGRHREAEAWHLQALGKSADDRPWQTAEHYAGLGTIYMETGRLAQASDMLGRAVELFKAWGSRRGTLIALINLGTVKRQLGLINEARAIFDTASELQAEGGDRLTDCYLSVHTAIFYHENGKTVAARAAYLQALEMMRELGERRLEGMTLGALANLYRSIGYTARAETAYHEALALHEIMRDTRSAGIVLGNLASLYQDTGRFAQAEETYVQALDAHRDSGNLRSEAIARGNLAILYRETGRIAGANRLFEHAIGQLEEVGDIAVRAAFIAHRGSLCLLCGNIEGAAADAAEVAGLLGDKAPALRLENALPLHFRMAIARAVPLDFGEVEGATRERELAAAKATLAEMTRLHSEVGHKQSSQTAKLLSTCSSVLAEVEAALNEWRPPRIFRGFLPSELQPQLRQALLGLMRDLDREHFKDFCWQNPYLHSSMAEGSDGTTPPDWTSLPRN